MVWLRVSEAGLSKMAAPVWEDAIHEHTARDLYREGRGSEATVSYPTPPVLGRGKEKE